MSQSVTYTTRKVIHQLYISVGNNWNFSYNMKRFVYIANFQEETSLHQADRENGVGDGRGCEGG